MSSTCHRGAKYTIVGQRLQGLPQVTLYLESIRDF